VFVVFVCFVVVVLEDFTQGSHEYPQTFWRCNSIPESEREARGWKGFMARPPAKLKRRRGQKTNVLASAESRTNDYSHTDIRGNIVGSGRETVFDFIALRMVAVVMHSSSIGSM
jgi:hypothetical protein